MINFNTAELKKAVSLTTAKNLIDLNKVVVRNATYSGDTFPEGVIPLKTEKYNAINLEQINGVNRLLGSIWGSLKVLVQVGTLNRKTVLFVYINE